MFPKVKSMLERKRIKHMQDRYFGLMDITKGDIDSCMTEYAEIFEKLGR